MSNAPTGAFLRSAMLVLGLAVPSSGVMCQTHSWQANVGLDQLGLSSAPSTQGRILANLPLGENVGILLKLRIHDEEWCKVRVSATLAVGYVRCEALKPGKSVVSSQPAPERPSPIVTAAMPAPAAVTPNSTPRASTLVIDQSTSLTNKDVLDLNKVGLTSEVLVSKIKSSNCNFDTSPAALQELKLQHVSDSVILAIVQAPKSQLRPARNSPEVVSAPTAQPHEAVTNDLIPRRSRVFIEPMDGFETFLAAALEKKKVPLDVVNDPQFADLTIGGNSDSKKAGWAKIVFMGNLHSDEEASITMVNTKTHAVVFAYAVNKKNTLHGEQTSAEACAKHLKQKMEGHE